jgi:hypothetical protein
MKATARLLVGITLMMLFSTPAASPQSTTPSQTEGLIEAHEAILATLHAERARLKIDKTTLLNVIGLAQDLRNVELRIASRPIERIAAFNRFRSLILDLEADVKTPLNRQMLDAERVKIEAELNVAKRDAVQVEQINKQRRSQILQERNLWRRDLDGSPLLHPILPPKLAENRR